jgi:hypothetical protein
MPTRFATLAVGLLASLPLAVWTMAAGAQEQLPWTRGSAPSYQPPDRYYADPPAATNGSPASTNGSYAPRYGAPTSDAYSPRYPTTNPAPNDAYAPPYATGRTGVNDAYVPRYGANQPRADDAYAPPRGNEFAQAPGGYRPDAGQPAQTYGQPYPSQQGNGQTYSSAPGPTYGQPYTAPGQGYDDPRGPGYGQPGSERDRGLPPYENGTDTFSSREILDAGHGFFGSVSKGLAGVVEYAFQKQGRPNGYILGQDAGGAFVAGLRYGEGTLYTKDAGAHRVYWQGPSIGWDAGVEGSKVMVLVYNLRDPEDVYQRFGGLDGSAYLVGGVGVTFLKNDDIVLAPIRAGLGVRLGANLGYLKYTRQPTWNPF